MVRLSRRWCSSLCCSQPSSRRCSAPPAPLLSPVRTPIDLREPRPSNSTASTWCGGDGISRYSYTLPPGAQQSEDGVSPLSRKPRSIQAVKVTLASSPARPPPLRPFPAADQGSPARPTRRDSGSQGLLPILRECPRCCWRGWSSFSSLRRGALTLHERVRKCISPPSAAAPRPTLPPRALPSRNTCNPWRSELLG